MRWPALEKLVHHLQQEGLLIDVECYENYVIIHTTTYSIVTYFPYSERIKESFAHNQVIHLDMDVLENAYTKVISRIKSLCGKGTKIYARNTVVARVDKAVAMEFLEEYHLQVAIPGKYRYGLFYKGDLVSVAIFSGGRRMRDKSEDYRSFELLRFCHKGGYLVVGGISKLIKAFNNDFQPSDIMTYADKDWSMQSSLSVIGFEVEGCTEEQTFYISNGQRFYNLPVDGKYDYLVKNSGSIKLKLYLS